jgi:hypothetical protein
VPRRFRRTQIEWCRRLHRCLRRHRIGIEAKLAEFAANHDDYSSILLWRWPTASSKHWPARTRVATWRIIWRTRLERRFDPGTLPRHPTGAGLSVCPDHTLARDIWRFTRCAHGHCLALPAASVSGFSPIPEHGAPVASADWQKTMRRRGLPLAEVEPGSPPFAYDHAPDRRRQPCRGDYTQPDGLSAPLPGAGFARRFKRHKAIFGSLARLMCGTRYCRFFG